MKKVIASLLAAALIAPIAAEAQPVQRNWDRAGRSYSQQDRHEAIRYHQQQVHRFARGDRFDRNRASNYRRLDYRQVSRLTAPGRNQIWVRAGDDALLVSLRNNTVQRIVPNVF